MLLFVVVIDFAVDVVNLYVFSSLSYVEESVSSMPVDIIKYIFWSNEVFYPFAFCLFSFFVVSVSLLVCCLFLVMGLYVVQM